MANIKSAKKRNLQNEKRRERNASVKSAVRTSAKKVVKAISAKPVKAEEIDQLQKEFVKTIDTAAGKGVLHKKTAARKKSKIAKKVNAVKSQSV